MCDEGKSETLTLAPETNGKPINVFSLMDNYDDKAITAQLQQKDVLEKFVYRFTDSRGKQVTDLSKVGIDGIVLMMEREGMVIRDIDMPDIKDNPDHYLVTVKAGRYAIDGQGHEQLLTTSFGNKKQKKKMQIYETKWDAQAQKKKRTGNKIWVDNEFAFEQALMKASRNAKKRLMPHTLIAKVIAARIAAGDVKDIKVNGVIDDDGNVVSEPGKKSEPTEKIQKTKLFKQIVDAKRTAELNEMLKEKGYKTYQDFSIAELQGILKIGASTDLAAEHPAETLYKEMVKEKNLTISYEQFVGMLKNLFQHIDVEKPTAANVSEMRDTLKNYSKKDIEG